MFTTTGSKDPPFRIYAVRGAFRHVATRRAVVGSLLGSDAIRHAQESLDRLRGLWQAVLYRLRDVRWEALGDDGRHLKFMANCPPFGVKTDTSTRPCKRVLVCPFCYGREMVLKPFFRMENILYGRGDSAYLGPNGKLLPLARPDLKIVAFRTVTRGTKFVPDDLCNFLPVHCEKAKAVMEATKRVEVDGFDAEYGCVQFRVYPLEKSGRLAIVRTGVLLVPGGVSEEALGMYRSAGRKSTVAQYPPSKQNLCSAFAAAFRYPAQMTKEDPWLVARMLEQFRRTRTYRWYGPRESKSHN